MSLWSAGSVEGGAVAESRCAYNSGYAYTASFAIPSSCTARSCRRWGGLRSRDVCVESMLSPLMCHHNRSGDTPRIRHGQCCTLCSSRPSAGLVHLNGRLTVAVIDALGLDAPYGDGWKISTRL